MIHNNNCGSVYKYQEVVSGQRCNYLFLFFSESFVLALLWAVLAVPDLEILSSLRRLLCEKGENGKPADEAMTACFISQHH